MTLGARLRHFKLQILVQLRIRQVAMPWYFLEVGLKLLFATGQEGLGHAHLNVFGNARFKHNVPEGELGALHLDDLSRVDLFSIAYHWDVQGSQLLEQRLLQAWRWPDAVSEYRLKCFLCLLNCGPCGCH